MQEKYYTIKQLADKYKVSKTAIRHQIAKIEYKPYIAKKKVKNRESVIIYQTGANKLFEHFISSDKTVTSINDTNNSSSKHDKVISNDTSNVSSKYDEVIGNENGNKTNIDTENISSNENEVSYKESAREIIKAKDEMISILKKEIENLHIELQHEQELHMADQHRAKNLEEQLSSYISDNRENHTKNVLESSSDIKNNDTRNNISTKHWWQFWK